MNLNYTSIIFFCFSIFSFSNLFSQKTFNLDFEETESGMVLDWNNFGTGDYILDIDSSVVQNGKYSVSIEHGEGKADFKAWAYAIPATYQGEKIKLTGYMKTENVEGGHAGLWMRIDPGLAFDNMQSQGITGTHDWTKHEITLDLKSSQAQQIVVGGLIVGSGKIWIDNLSITIDGTDIHEAPLKELKPAEKDDKFDKGSDIVLPELDDQLTSELELLGKVWGLVKYHHPEVAKGNYNWDAELFRMLPKFWKKKRLKERKNFLFNGLSRMAIFHYARVVKLLMKMHF